MKSNSDGLLDKMPKAHRRDIQGLRGLAVLLVVIYHASTVLHGGFVGVDMFFAISGFVICRLLTNEISTTGRINLKNFYLRRFRRLLPALAFMLAVVLILGFVLVPFRVHAVTAKTGIATALFSSNAYLFVKANVGYFDPAATTNPLLHTWSLSVEEQFYFLFPAILAFIAWLGRKRPNWLRRMLKWSLGAVAIGSFLLSWLFVSGKANFASKQRLVDLAFYSSPTRAWEFALGALLALWSVDLARLRKSRVMSRALTSGGFLGVALVVFASVSFSGKTIFPGPAAAVPVLGTCCLIFAGGEETGFWGRLLGGRLLVSLGDISYGWYLWHWPFIVFGRALFPGSAWIGVGAAVLSLVPAWISLKFIENPIRFAPSPRSWRTLRLAGVCIAIPVIAAGILSGASGTASASHFDIDKNPDLAWVKPFPCVFGKGDDAKEKRRCTTSLGTDHRRVFLIGDSNATQFTKVFNDVATTLGYSASVRPMLGCPFIDAKAVRPRGQADADRCSTFVRETLAEIAQERPSIVVISHSVDMYVTTPEFHIEDPSGVVAFTTNERKEEWKAAQQRILDELRNLGATVVLTQPTPRFGDWEAFSCVPVLEKFFESQCIAKRVVADMRRDREDILQFVNDMATPKVLVTDFFDTLCPDATCATHRDGHWLWADGQHLTKYGANLLTDDFTVMLNRAGRR